MKVLKRIWYQFVQSILDAALCAVIRLRKTALPPRPIVWRDPRPYRSWRLDRLESEFEALQRQREVMDLSGADIEDMDFKRGLVLDEILIQRGLRDDAPQIRGYN